jgi:hypothetical protein
LPDNDLTQQGWHSRSHPALTGQADASRNGSHEDTCHFDPDITDAFLANFGDFVAIAQRYDDGG